MTLTVNLLFFKGEGAFSRKDIAANTIVAQYSGYRMQKGQKLLPQNTVYGYRQDIGLGEGAIDIPNGYEQLNKYNGSLGHKLNHKFFYENCRMSFVRNHYVFY